MYYLLKLVLTLLSLLGVATITYAQFDLCQSCYVWEFTDEKGNRDEITKILTNDFEDILSQKGNCTVLQRNKFDKLYSQIQSENSIVSLSTINSTLLNELKVTPAKTVIFGTVSKDFQGNISLRVSFENLKTTQVKSNTLFLVGADAYNYNKRKETVEAFINSIIGIGNNNTNTKEKIVNPPPSDYPVKQNVNDLEVKIMGITRSGRDLSVDVRFTSKFKDRELVIYVYSGYRFNGGYNSSKYISKLYDNTGEEYIAKSATLGSISGEKYAGRRVVADIPTKGSLLFENISTQASKVALIELDIEIDGIEKKIQFRNLAIN